MMTQKLTRAQAKEILAQTFPEYRGRKIRLAFTTEVVLSDVNWGGGSKNTYHGVTANANGKRLVVPAPWNHHLEGAVVPLTKDLMIVEHTMFCGEDCGITIYAHPAHAPKWLTDGSAK